MDADNEKYNGKSPSEHPGHKWIMSKPAQAFTVECFQAAQKRDQDFFRMYIYNDFTSYGLQEVVAIALTAFDEIHSAVLKGRKSALELWACIEGLQWWLSMEDIECWYMIEDSEKVGDTIHVIGTAVLVTLNHLERMGNFSAVKNIPITLSLIYYWIVGFEGVMNCGAWIGHDEWPHLLLAYGKKLGIDIDGVYDSKELMKGYNESKASKRRRNLVYGGYTSTKFQWKEVVWS